MKRVLHLAFTIFPKTATLIKHERALYKYAVLERSPRAYKAIRALLKEKDGFPAAAFYGLAEETPKTPFQTGNRVNAVQHVWGYIKTEATGKEKQAFESLLAGAAEGSLPFARMKSQLHQLTPAVQRNGCVQLLQHFVPFRGRAPHTRSSNWSLKPS